MNCHRVAKTAQIWTKPFCHTCSHVNSNDCRIPSRRAPKICRYSATYGRRSGAHSAAAAWPPSHGKTAQDGVAASSQSRNQKEEKEKGYCHNSQETTRHGKDGSETPQEGMTGLNRIQKIPQPYKIIEENS